MKKSDIEAALINKIAQAHSCADLETILAGYVEFSYDVALAVIERAYELGIEDGSER